MLRLFLLSYCYSYPDIFLSFSFSLKKQDYTLPENYELDFYRYHKWKELKNNRGKVMHATYELKARWKGYGEEDDTDQELNVASEDWPGAVVSYLKANPSTTVDLKDYMEKKNTKTYNGVLQLLQQE